VFAWEVKGEKTRGVVLGWGIALARSLSTRARKENNANFILQRM
jgi:hypothetical protein